MKSNIILQLTIVSCLCANNLAVLALEYSWIDLSKKAQVESSAGQLTRAQSSLLSALKLAEASKAPANDKDFRIMMLEEIPNLVESLCQQKQYKEAKQLADQKISTAQALFGKSSPFIADGLQDLLVVESDQKYGAGIADALLQYGNICSEIRSGNKSYAADLETIIVYRKERLNRKLHERLDSLTNQLLPAAEIPWHN